jgi:predicted nucleic acid-binding protein
MTFVIDASVAASWLLPDEQDAASDAALAMLEDGGAVAPSLWWFEMRNLLLTNERRGRINASATAEAVRLLTSLPIRLDNAADGAELLAIARRRRLSAYDAAYVELAIRERLPLATIDRSLARAAEAEGVDLVGTTSGLG